jgi:hypothetical protein
MIESLLRKKAQGQTLLPALHATFEPLALIFLLYIAIFTAVYHGTLPMSLIISPLSIILIAVTNRA